MNSAELREAILGLHPVYSEKYRSFIETISNKGEKTGTGDIAMFGPIYQTYMYACVIGIRLKKKVYLSADDKPTSEFALIQKWKPIQIRDFVIMAILNRTEDFGYRWIDLENASDEVLRKFTSDFRKELEAYANAGFQYLYEKWKKERVFFSSSTVFVDILKDLNIPAE